MSSAETSAPQSESGTESPPEPSMPAAEELEPSEGGAGELGVNEYEGVSNMEEGTEYDADILHISDSEKDQPYSSILEEYEDEADFDFIMNTGDNYKLPGEVTSWDEEADGEYEPEDFDEDVLDEYIEGIQSHFEGVRELADEYGVEIGDSAGNHDPVIGTHKSEDSDAFKQAVNERAAEKFEDYDHENLRDYMLDEFDIIDMEGNSVEVNGVKIVGGLSGMDVEADDQYLEDRDLGEFYDEDELEEIAEELGRDERYQSLSKIPLVGDWLQSAANLAEMAIYGMDDVDIEDIDLEDIPEGMMSEGHANYAEAREEAMAEYNEKRDAIESMVAGHEGPVMIAGHQDMAVESEYGSRVFADLAEQYDNVVGVMGGHTHSQEVYEHGGAVNINSAETFSEVGVLEDEVHVDQYNYGETAESVPDHSQPSEEEEIRMIGRMLAQQKGQEDAKEMIESRREKAQEELDDGEELETAMEQFDHIEAGIEDAPEEGSMPQQPMNPQSPPAPEAPGTESGEETAEA